MMNTILIAASLVAAAPVNDPQPSVVVQEEDLNIDWKWKNGIRFETRNGQVKGKFGGRIQADASFLGISSNLDTAGFGSADATEFRRARLFISMDLFDSYFMKAQYDFAGSVSQSDTVSPTDLTVDFDDKRPSFKDVYVGKKDVIGSADLKIGHYKEPFSLDELTSSKYITFGERALPNAFAPGRNMGISLYDTALDGNATWAVGVFRQNSDNAGFSAEDGGYAVTARGTWTPIHEDEGEKIVHTGLAYSIRDNESARFRTRPEIHVSPRFVDTGSLASDDVDLGGIEVATVLGPFHAEAEYIMAEASGATGVADFDASAHYVQAGWFLTGEARPYKRSSGTFDRVKPNDNWGENGIGAVEVAVRHSSIDLTDGAVGGGKEDNISLGLNWYLNPNMRVAANYVMGEVDLGAGLSSENIDAVLFRFQIDW